MSRGRIRISTLRCPEVGLGIPDLTSGHLGIEGRLSGERSGDRSFFFRCPEVGLELSL